jgi:hypothetical protein
MWPWKIHQQGAEEKEARVLTVLRHLRELKRTGSGRGGRQERLIRVRSGLRV